MKPHNYVPKATCPACGRAVNRNNAGVLDPHYDQRTGKVCPGGLLTIEEAKCLFPIPRTA